jgi:hypothetical protein
LVHFGFTKEKTGRAVLSIVAHTGTQNLLWSLKLLPPLIVRLLPLILLLVILVLLLLLLILLKVPTLMMMTMMMTILLHRVDANHMCMTIYYTYIYVYIRILYAIYRIFGHMLHEYTRTYNACIVYAMWTVYIHIHGNPTSTTTYYGTYSTIHVKTVFEKTNQVETVNFIIQVRYVQVYKSLYSLQKLYCANY